MLKLDSKLLFLAFIQANNFTTFDSTNYMKGFMTEEMKIYWEVYHRLMPTSSIIREIVNPVRAYESDLINGDIIDVGCG